MSNFVHELYRKYFIDRQFERLDLFQIISGKFDLQRVLYPGSFVHVTPSFVFPHVVYVDSDKQAKKFFNDPEVQYFIARAKGLLSGGAESSFHAADYRKGFDEQEEGFDLLISQYAGFVGQDCKHYLKSGGLLLANNSHGDAGLAALDEDYELIAVFFLRDGKYRISEVNLDAYFVPKAKISVTKKYLLELQKGIGYQKSASAYLFRKVR